MRKGTRRKRWNPLYNPVRAAIMACSFTGDSENVQIQALFELHQLRSGTIGSHTLQIFSALIEISSRLSRRGIGPEVEQVCARARLQLEAFKRSGTVSQELLEVLTELYDWHEAQREGAGAAAYVREACGVCHLAA